MHHGLSKKNKKNPMNNKVYFAQKFKPVLIQFYRFLPHSYTVPNSAVTIKHVLTQSSPFSLHAHRISIEFKVGISIASAVNASRSPNVHGSSDYCPLLYLYTLLHFTPHIPS